MEGYVYKWLNFIKGWKARYLILENNILYCLKNRDDIRNKTIDVIKCKILDEKKKKHFTVETSEKKLYFKTNTEEEKQTWINILLESQIKNDNQVEEHIFEKDKRIEDKVESNFKEKGRFSTAYMLYNDEINKFHGNVINPYDKVIKNLLNIQNLIFELTYSIEDYSNIIKTNNKEELSRFYNDLNNIKNEMKEQVNQCMKNTIEYKDYKDKNSEIEVIKQNSEIFYHAKEGSLSIHDKSYENEDISDTSFSDCNEIEREKSSDLFKASLEESLLKEGYETNDLFQKSLSLKISDFYDPIYNFKRRINLPEKIICSNSMITDMLKALSKEKVSLPITYNEPISMLQKQCEKFKYTYLLDKANEIEDESLKMCYIAAFIISEISLNINRILKPFNPILGETFEYIDNDLCYRFFSEQVSHSPPISAYICESEEYVVYGDTRSKNKFRIMKGAVEIDLLSFTYILFKKSNILYRYNKPTVYFKGLFMGTPHFDYSGIINIENLNNSGISATIDFYEEGRKSKPLGFYEGKVINNGVVKYLIKGNWNYEMNYSEANQTFSNQIWKIEDEPCIHNKDFINNYLISEYACNFNFLDDELKKILPLTDSRFRPDQRALENRQMELAEKEKIRIENKQRERHKQFEEEKIKYEPYYFSFVFNEKTNDYVYIYKGDYWKDRNEKNFEKLYKIFN